MSNEVKGYSLKTRPGHNGRRVAIITCNGRVFMADGETNSEAIARVRARYEEECKKLN